MKEDTQRGQNNSCATTLLFKFGFCNISYPIRPTERLKSIKVNHDKMYIIGNDFFRLYLSYKKPKLFRVRILKDKDWHLSIFLTIKEIILSPVIAVQKQHFSTLG